MAVIGAGSVGATLAYALLVRGSARTVALYDNNESKVRAEVLDLSHGTQFTPGSEVIGGADPDVIGGAQVIVITAGAKQKPGQSRLDLAATNVELLRGLLPVLLGQAPDAVFVLVTNPCDVLTVAAQKFSGLPSHRVFASGTVLDTSRLRQILADRAQVATSSVHADIVGEHGDSEFALWSQARIGPVPILDWESPTSAAFNLEELARISEDVRTAAYRVIEGKGATNYAIGLSAARIVEAILNNHHAVLPVSSVLNGFHGIDSVALSIPSVVNSSGVSHVVDLPMSQSEQIKLQESAAALRELQRTLDI